MNIYVNDTSTHQPRVLLSVEPDATSYRVRQIMTPGYIVLYYSLPAHVELPVGAFVNYQGVKYTLVQPEAFRMVHQSNYEYTVTFQAPEYWASIWLVSNPIDHRLTFDYTATPREHLQLIVDNLNARDVEGGWSIGECVDGVEKVISYSHTYCFDAIKDISDAYHTEFVVAGKSISLRMAEYHLNDPLPLCYGYGNGFRSGVGRTNEESMPTVGRLYVQGGDRNIDYSKYGTYVVSHESEGIRLQLVHSHTLLLPRGVRYRYDGAFFEDEQGFREDNARTYQTDPLGLYVERVDSSIGMADVPYDASGHYPRRIGVVSAVETVAGSDGSILYDILDASIPESLDYSDYWIEGEKMTVIFQSGMLAGREFDIDENNGYEHASRRFKLVPQEYDGFVMPSADDGFVPAVGDEYIVFGCALPDAYYRDNTTRTGAEWDMLRAAIRYRFPREDYLYTFSGDIDEIWAHKNWGRISDRFGIGEYVRFRDTHISTDVLLRMQTIKDYINTPWRMELTLTNAPARVDFVDEIRRIERRTSAKPRTQSDKVRLYVDKQTNYRFVRGLDDLSDVEVTPVYSGRNVYDEDARVEEWVEEVALPAATVLHKYSTGVTTYHLSGTWGQVVAQATNLYQVGAATLPILEGANNEAYIYAKIKKDHSVGTWAIQGSKHSYTDSQGYLWLYMGYLKAVEMGTRTYVRMYRFIGADSGSVAINANVDGQSRDLGDLVNEHNTGLNNVRQSIISVSTKVNQVVERSNDLTTLLVNRLSEAINAFNSAQGEGGNHIDFDTCIRPGLDTATEACKRYDIIDNL